MTFRRLHVALFACLLLVATSCGKSSYPGPRPYPVHGKVTYQGQPAKKFRVTFYPLKEFEKVRFAPAAVTDENGEFRLRSYDPDDGAPAGQYAVTCTWPRRLNTINEPDAGPEVDRLGGKYADPKKSAIRVTVREGKNELEPFALK